jgi:hypothetical protein
MNRTGAVFFGVFAGGALLAGGFGAASCAGVEFRVGSDTAAEDPSPAVSGEPILQPYVELTDSTQRVVSMELRPNALPGMDEATRRLVMNATVRIETPEFGASGVVLQTSENTVQIATAGHFAIDVEHAGVENTTVTAGNGVEVPIRSVAVDWRTKDRQLTAADDTVQLADMVEDLGVLNPVHIRDAQWWLGVGVVPLEVRDLSAEPIQPLETLWSSSYKSGYAPPSQPNFYRVLAAQQADEYPPGVFPMPHSLRVVTDVDPEVSDDMSAPGTSGAGYVDTQGRVVALHSWAPRQRLIPENTPCRRRVDITTDQHRGWQYKATIDQHAGPEPCTTDPEALDNGFARSRLVDHTALEYFLSVATR